MTLDKLETARLILRDKEEAQWLIGEMKDIKDAISKERMNYVLERLSRREYQTIQEELKPLVIDILDKQIKKLEEQIKLADQAFEAL